MAGFTKLHSQIIHSSIWRESPAVKVVWITMMAMADSTGTVYASVGGLAHAAGVSREECEEALEKFLGPDPDSSDGTTGERIERVPGGWHLLNYDNYRDRQTREQALAADRQRRYREKQDEALRNVTSRDITLSGSNPSASSSSSSSASEKKKGVDRPDDVDEQTWEDWLAHRKSIKATVTQTVLTRLRNQAKEANLPLAEVMAICCANGWRGFNADWVQKRDARGKPAGEAQHPRNTPIGLPTCPCRECVRFREAQRDRARGGDTESAADIAANMLRKVGD